MTSSRLASIAGNRRPRLSNDRTTHSDATYSFGQISDVLPEDVLIHTWDLARATGGDEQLDTDLVAHVFEHVKPLDDMLRQPWAFGPKVTPPSGADLQTEFGCFAGRNP